MDIHVTDLALELLDTGAIPNSSHDDSTAAYLTLTLVVGLRKIQVAVYTTPAETNLLLLLAKAVEQDQRPAPARGWVSRQILADQLLVTVDTVSRYLWSIVRSIDAAVKLDLEEAGTEVDSWPDIIERKPMRGARFAFPIRIDRYQ